MSEKRRVFCSMCGKRRYEEHMRVVPYDETSEKEKTLCNNLGKGDFARHESHSHFTCYELYVRKRTVELKLLFDGMKKRKEAILNVETKEKNAQLKITECKVKDFC